MLRFIVAAAATSLLASCAASGAPGKETASKIETPHNLSGTWRVMNRANFDLEAHGAHSAMQMVKGPVNPVPDKRVVALGAVGAVPAGLSVLKGGGNIPYTAEALEQRNNNKANWITEDPEVKCYLPGVPRATYMPYPFKIMQNDEAMLIVYEYANTVRNIELTDPGEAPLDSWMGQSYGHWDGNTFVIEVTAQNGSTWLDRSGNFMSYEGKVTERYTPIGPNHIKYEATIEDPATYTEPWTIEMTLYRAMGADAELQEFNCVEFVEELMYGHLRKEPVQ